MLPTLAELEDAAQIVYRSMPPTPAYRWPLLDARCGREVWVKHENHTPIGAFKVRGGLVYVDDLCRTQPAIRGIISATRGNHGQSLAFAARLHGLTATVVVPHGNSVEKNAAMRALGAEVVEQGHDFQASSEAADALGRERGLHRVPSFDPLLVRGVGTYALELFRAVPDLDAVYVPIGQGSGISGVIAARNAFGLRTKVIAVVAESAPTYALSLERGAPVSHEVTTRIADGMACRTPVEEALTIIGQNVERVVTVTDDEIEDAMRTLFADTHNVAEGAGAAALAAVLCDIAAGERRVAFILSGGNVDTEAFARVLSLSS
jgi:threonine dehydratase